MTNDNNMKVVFNNNDNKKDIINNNIKEIIGKPLSDAEIGIGVDEFDIIVAELPDNEENIEKLGPLEKNIQVWISDLPIEARIKKLMEKPHDQITPAGLCEAMEQILREMGNENVFSRTCRINRGRLSGSARNYHLLIVVGLKKSASGYTELCKYMIDNIKEKLKEAGDFLQMGTTETGRQRLFGDMQKKWILFGKFAEYYMLKNQLPEPGILIKMSAARYEGSESEARIYFTRNAIDMIEQFSVTGKEDRIVKEQNLRMIRKLMEISKRNKVHLYAETSADTVGGKTVHTVSGLVQHREKQNEDIYVKFSGFMHWSLFIKGREIFTYYHGDYQFNVSKEKYAYLNDINKLKGFDQKKREMIEKLVEVLRKQKHGTVAIVFDEKTNAEDEADRLCNMKRGTRICESICYDEEKGCWDEEQILAVSGIDGAMFIDHCGKCLAIGVIVDGEAVEPGNVGRGARYNSIVNYMKLHQGCVGIVISEDGMIDVIQKSE